MQEDLRKFPLKKAISRTIFASPLKQKSCAAKNRQDYVKKLADSLRLFLRKPCFEFFKNFFRRGFGVDVNKIAFCPIEIDERCR